LLAAQSATRPATSEPTRTVLVRRRHRRQKSWQLRGLLSWMLWHVRAPGEVRWGAKSGAGPVAIDVVDDGPKSWSAAC